MKAAAALAILLAIVGVQSVRAIGASGTDNETVFGNCAGLALLRRGTVTTRFRIGQTVTNTFECTGTTVDCVIVRNLKPFRGATPTATALGGATVTVTLTSERSAGIKSVVECYGT